MGQENELIRLLLGIGAFIFVLLNWSKLKRLPVWHALLGAFGLLLIGWMLSIVQGFVWRHALHLLEHACYAGGAGLVAMCCWKLSARPREESHGARGVD